MRETATLTVHDSANPGHSPLPHVATIKRLELLRVTLPFSVRLPHAARSHDAAESSTAWSVISNTDNAANATTTAVSRTREKKPLYHCPLVLQWSDTRGDRTTNNTHATPDQHPNESLGHNDTHSTPTSNISRHHSYVETPITTRNTLRTAGVCSSPSPAPA